MIGLVKRMAIVAAASCLSPGTFAQSNAAAALTQMSLAVSGGLPILKVAFEGTATYYAGSTVETGTATLTADPTGMVVAQFAMGKHGTRTEQVAAGPLSACTWSCADGVSHDGNGLSCWRSAAWFFPPVSLQLASLLSSVGVSDLGTGTVGKECTATCRASLCLRRSTPRGPRNS